MARNCCYYYYLNIWYTGENNAKNMHGEQATALYPSTQGTYMTLLGVEMKTNGTHCRSLDGALAFATTGTRSVSTYRSVLTSWDM